MAFVDTNIVLRWLLGDHQELTARAEQIVATAGRGGLQLTDVVVAEIFYVLRGKKYNRRQIAEALAFLEKSPKFAFEHEEIIDQLIELVVNTKLDFADCYLLARARSSKQPLCSFDQALQKLLDSRDQ